MPFDFTETTASAAVSEAMRVATSKAKLTDKRAALIAATEVAAEEGYGPIDWRGLALALANVVPVPRTPAKPEDSSAGEWKEYTPAQRRGRGASFKASRTALFRFADGQIIRVNLSHKTSQDMPDWAKAARVAVSFYKARRARNFLRLVGDTHGTVSPCHAEEYADGCAVPEIVQALDENRKVEADVSQANAFTAERREGPAYLSELVGYAADLGGDWHAAWRAARAATYRALERDAVRRARKVDAEIIAA